jgi:peptidoglycan/xylan/chitin deacetylase (PgdA/CDA1 family)
MIKTILGQMSGGRKDRRMLILTYHRVRDCPDPVWPWDPDRQEFISQMRVIKEYFNPLTISEAMELIDKEELPERAVCLTFDDGYADNYEIAFPILSDLKITATFFIATGYLNGGEMWNDRVLEVVRQIEPGTYDFGQLGEIRVLENSEKSEIASQLLNQMKYMPSAERDQLSRKLAQEFGIRNNDQVMMSDRMVSEMHRNGLEIGSHTVSHPILAQLSLAEAKKEIHDSKVYLESLLDTRIRSFAYPNGKSGTDLTERDIDIVRESGYQVSVTTDWGPAIPSSNRFALPRIGIYGNNSAKLLVKMGLAYRGS